MKFLLTPIFLVFLNLLLQGQTTYLFNSSINNTTITTCDGILVDDGGLNGNYSTNQSFSLTIQPGYAGAKAQLWFINWDVSIGTTLFVYNGTSDADPLLGSFDESNSPMLLNLVSSHTSGKLFLKWTSGLTGDVGFAAEVKCNIPCQTSFIAMDSLLCDPHLENGYIDICKGDTVTFAAHGIYPQNGLVYNQSDNSSDIIWVFGDDDLDTGNVVTHVFNEIKGYNYSVYLIDTAGCQSNVYTGRVRVAGTPVGYIFPMPPICTGDTFRLNYGSTAAANIVVNPYSSSAIGTLGVADTTYLPDGSGVDYTSSVVYSIFEPGQVLTSVNDFLGVCMDLFHSYSGDIDISLTCPNGTTVALTSQPGGGVQFGEPPVPAVSGPSAPCYGEMGVSYTYCWTTSPDYGTMASEAAGAPTHTYTNVCGNTISPRYFPAGSYEPDESLSALIGCPLNGTWSINITDNIGLDEGYITSWAISLNPNLIPGGWEYSVPVDTIYWSGDGLLYESDSTSLVIPTMGGSSDYILTIIDEYGCAFDTTVVFNVVQTPNPQLMNDTIVCEGTILDITCPQTANSIAWNTGSTAYTIQTDIDGYYIATLTNTNGSLQCVAKDTVFVDFYPVAKIDLGNDTCVVSPLTLDAENPGFYFEWSTGANTQTIQATQSGTYSVTASFDDTKKCPESDEITITYIPTAIINLPDIQELCSYESIDLSVEQNSPDYTYNWSVDAIGALCHIEASQLPLGPNPIFVSVMGCDTVQDSIIVKVNPCEINIPNIMTPNGDNINDVFFVTNIEYYPNSLLMVYNRWGTKVYENANYLNNFTGENLPDGTYYFVLRVNYGEEKLVEHKGTITILRN